MKFGLNLLLLLIILSPVTLKAQTKRVSSTTREYISPVDIVWTSHSPNSTIDGANILLNNSNTGQATLVSKDICTLTNGDEGYSSILLDFGREMHGGVEIVTGLWEGNGVKEVRVRFGESVSEAMSDVGGSTNAKNDHAIRDQKILLPFLGKREIGNSGFRFVRIDFEEPNTLIKIKEINAISIYRDIEYLGSFECDDQILNDIWSTGAYTVHLNMQNFLWDGVKRDRLVWIGDMHPEVMTINSVFGYNEVVPKSLDLIRDNTPHTAWMNGISSYSMWWILIHKEWFTSNGNLDYLKEQSVYMKALLTRLCSAVDEDGQEHLDGSRFLDWPSANSKEAVDAGYQALLKMTLEAGYEMMTILKDSETAQLCSDKSNLISDITPDPVGSKQAASLLHMANLISDKVSSEIVLEGGSERFSTFYGYYMLQSLAKSGDYSEAIDIIKEYWGGMLKLGATTFWEDFDMDWMVNGGRIDKLPKEGEVDVHATYGNYCYQKLRHSLCHGWASGPTPWLSEHVLGIKILEPGCRVVQVRPNLGSLKWAKGTFPTPMGVITVEHRVDSKGRIKTEIDAPKGVKIVR